MFLRILRKDLGRKKTMNIILLLFVIMCSMFASASISNIVAIYAGIDGYFDKAGLPDMIVVLPYEADPYKVIEKMSNVSDLRIEKNLTVLNAPRFKKNGKSFATFTNIAVIMNDEERAINYFGEDNELLPPVEKGTFYATGSFSEGSDLKPGDEVELSNGGIKKTYIYKGLCKSAIRGTALSDSPLLIFSAEDFAEFEADSDFKSWARYVIYFNTDDPDIIQELAKSTANMYAYTRESFKSLYFNDMLIAYMMMAISVMLLLTGSVMLRFTIGFTISEEIREIGVMKAIGIGNPSIRLLYIVKYLGIALIGAAAGYFCSLPLSDMMLDRTSHNMVLSTDSNASIGLVSSGTIIVLIMLFSYICTRRVKKLSPIDAVRNGQTGERFRRKTIMHLGRSKLPASVFMPINDILSAPKQFGLICLISTMCGLMMSCVSSFVETLDSDIMLEYFSAADSQITWADMTVLSKIMGDDAESNKAIEKAEKLLADNGMPARCAISTGAIYEISHKDKKTLALAIINKGVPASEFHCDEGQAPRKPDEIILTRLTMKKIGAKIGDRVKLYIGGKYCEFIITGRFSSFLGGGEAAMLHESFTHRKEDITNTNGMQILFEGDPDEKTVEGYIEKIKELTGTEMVYTNKDLVVNIVGLTDVLSSIKYMMMILTAVITALVIVLMERSFISKEKGEIALMKAIGIKDGSIIRQHVLRFVIVSAAACLLTFLLTVPACYLMFNWVTKMIGDVTGVFPVINCVDEFVICPAILIGVTVLSAFFTALYSKTVRASDTASTE